MTKKYWYAPQLRPPAFGGMPSAFKPMPERERMFDGQRFAAWAYAEELPKEAVEHFTLKLVLTEVA